MMKVVHLIYRLDFGGLERFMVDMINRFPPDYEHCVISLTDATDFKTQLRSGVDVHCLGKKAGQDFGIHFKLAKLLRQVKADILHTYNFATIEYHLIAKFAGIKGHLHAEHGRDISDPMGLNKKHNLLRRLVAPFIHQFVAVSQDLADWLVDVVGISQHKVTVIPNGIDLSRFQPNKEYTERLSQANASVRFVHVARFQAVKNQPLLLKAFNQCYLQAQKAAAPLPSLILVGDGGIRQELEQLKDSLECAQAVTFAGMQANVQPYYVANDVFVLSSVAEGTPMTVLEAMASGLPVISTRVGGLVDIISDQSGALVPSEDVNAMANAMFELVQAPSQIVAKGQAARAKMEADFDQKVCDNQYQALYKRALNKNTLS